MKRIYIAGKIGGLSEQEYVPKFERAKFHIKKSGARPISPLDLPHNHARTWGDYMREELTEMLKCDAVYALHDWRQSPGATIEINLALAVGIDVIHEKVIDTKP